MWTYSNIYSINVALKMSMFKDNYHIYIKFATVRKLAVKLLNPSSEPCSAEDLKSSAYKSAYLDCY